MYRQDGSAVTISDNLFSIEDKKVEAVQLKRHVTDPFPRSGGRACTLSGYETTLERTKAGLEQPAVTYVATPVILKHEPSPAG